MWRRIFYPEDGGNFFPEAKIYGFVAFVLVMLDISRRRLVDMFMWVGGRWCVVPDVSS